LPIVPTTHHIAGVLKYMTLTRKKTLPILRHGCNCKLSLIMRSHMSRVRWSSAQKAHQERLKEAVLDAKMAMKNPEVRYVYEQMAAEKKNNKHPFDVAVSDYFGNPKGVAWRRGDIFLVIVVYC
jgi:hypothetical protein